MPNGSSKSVNPPSLRVFHWHPLEGAGIHHFTTISAHFLTTILSFLTPHWKNHLIGPQNEKSFHQQKYCLDDRCHRKLGSMGYNPKTYPIYKYRWNNPWILPVTIDPNFLEHPSATQTTAGLTRLHRPGTRTGSSLRKYQTTDIWCPPHRIYLNVSTTKRTRKILESLLLHDFVYTQKNVHFGCNAGLVCIFIILY